MKRYSWLLVASTVFLAVSLIFSPVANALLGTLNTGYFNTNDYMPNGAGWGNVIDCGANDPITQAMTNKQTFIAVIKSFLSTGNYNCGNIGLPGSFNIVRNQTGAAFIIQTMRGKQAGTASIQPTASDITDWENRINSSAVTIGWYPAYPYYYNSGYMSGVANDDAFTDRLGPNTRDSLVFYDNGKIVYALKYDCANPVDDLPGLSNAATWNLTGTASVSSSTALPGKSVTFSYSLANSGDATASNISWSTYQTYQGTTTKEKSSTASIAGNSTYNPPNESFTIPTTAQSGTQYCRYLQYPDSEANQTPQVHSNSACVTVLSNYDIYPNINDWKGGSPDPLMLDQSVTINAFSAVNNGNNADDSTNYEIDHFYIPSSQAKPDFSALFKFNPPSGVSAGLYADKISYSGTNGCGWLAATYGSKTILGCGQDSTGTYKFPADTTALPIAPATASVTIDGSKYQPGDWACVMVTVGDFYNYNVSNAALHRATYPECYVIGKKPTIQFWGDDIHAGTSMSGMPANNTANVFTSHFTAKNSLGQNATYGSWAEYGIFAPALVGSISGGAVSGPDGFYTPWPIPTPVAHPLTFANTSVIAGSNYGGKWGAPGQIPSVQAFAQQYQSTAPINAAVVHVDNLPGVGTTARIMQVPITSTTSTQTKVSGTFTANGVAILESKGDVIIDGDINLSQTSINGLGSAQQLIIIARNIIINDNVTHIDAWLVAKQASSTDTGGGRISTCDVNSIGTSYLTGIKLNVCNKQLQINGALIAKEVQFRRTFGADPGNYSKSAEIVNLRADAYMWAQGASTSGGSGLPIETTFTTELPPRY